MFAAKIRHLLGLLLCVLLVGGWDGCLPPISGINSGGFNVNAKDHVTYLRNGIPIGFADFPHPGAVVDGNWTSDSFGAVGNTTEFVDAITNVFGDVYIDDGRVWANWYTQVDFGHCGTSNLRYASKYVYVTPYGGIPWTCAYDELQIGPISTHFARIGSNPATLKIDGQELSSQYGFPLLYVYNRNGQLSSSMTATSVSPDGSGATFPFPTTSSVTCPRFLVQS